MKYANIGGFDPARIASQIIVGIGFLGAGSIILQGNRILGLTTAGGLWARHEEPQSSAATKMEIWYNGRARRHDYPNQPRLDNTQRSAPSDPEYTVHVMVGGRLERKSEGFGQSLQETAWMAS